MISEKETNVLLLKGTTLNFFFTYQILIVLNINITIKVDNAAPFIPKTSIK